MYKRQYTRATGPAIEKEISRLNNVTARASGNPGYQGAQRRLQAMLSKVEKMRPLRRSEYIDLYGYPKWLAYAEANGLPENHKWADAEFQKKGPQDQIADMMG